MSIECCKTVSERAERVIGERFGNPLLNYFTVLRSRGRIIATVASLPNCHHSSYAVSDRNARLHNHTKPGLLIIVTVCDSKESVVGVFRSSSNPLVVEISTIATHHAGRSTPLPCCHWRARRYVRCSTNTNDIERVRSCCSQCIGSR